MFLFKTISKYNLNPNKVRLLINYDSFSVPNYKLFSCLRLPQSQGYDRNILESLSNRRDNVSLIVVVVGDRTSNISLNKVDGHVQIVCDLSASHMIVPPIACGRTTVARSVVRSVTSCSDWLYDQSLMLPTISICNRSSRLVVRAITNDWRR